MNRDELERAAALLEEAAEDAADEAAEAIRTQAEQLRSLVERERGPDHGRLDRHQQALRDIEASVDENVSERIDEANALITEYRMTLEGV